jgi:serine/threonine protein phosphatase PrpC
MGGKVVWCGVVDDSGKPVPDAGIYRVNGNLSISRATRIGDRSERPAVTFDPDVTTYSIEEGDEFKVLGSEGLWDVMSSQKVVAFVHTTLQGAILTVVSGVFLLFVLL